MLAPSPIPLTTTTAPAVRAAGLCKEIDERPILRHLTFDIAPGQFTALLGANGAGKSTLLKVLATLTPLSQGELRLFGQSVADQASAARARIGLIGHQSMLYRDLSARQNLEFFAALYGVKNAAARIEELLNAVKLSDRADDAVKAFSRGMTQRLAIARALVHRPDLLLADEPFDGLDAPSAHALEELLADLHRAGMTIILANHDIDQSIRLAPRAIVLRKGQIVIDRPADALARQDVLNAMIAAPV